MAIIFRIREVQDKLYICEKLIVKAFGFYKIYSIMNKLLTIVSVLKIKLVLTALVFADEEH